MNLPKARIKETGEIIEVNQIDLYSMVATINKVGADEDEVITSSDECSVADLTFLDKIELNYE